MDAIRLDELIEQAPEAVAILSPEDRVVRISKEFARLFGSERDEVLGRHIHDLIVPETLLESAREINQPITGAAVNGRARVNGLDCSPKGTPRQAQREPYS